MDVEAIKVMDKDTLLNPETIYEIQSLSESKPMEYIDKYFAILERAKVFRVKAQVEAKFKAAEKEIKNTLKEMTEAADNKANTELANQGETALSLINDNSWISSEDGVYQYKNGRLEVACYCPIRIKEILADMENDKWKVRLEFTKDGKTKEVIVPRQTIADYHKIIDLANYGVSVTSQTAKNLVQYLSLCELNRAEPIPTRNSLSRFGWVDGNKFVPYCDEIYFAGDEAISSLKKAISVVDGAEAWDEWMGMYKQLRKRTKEHPEPQLFVSAALSSVLINPLKEIPFLLNLWSESGAGKTLTLQLAASVWGAPSQYISDSDSTVNALVVKASILYDLPLIADDFAKATRDQKQLSNLVYALSSGKEKDRLNSDSQLKGGKRWHGCTLSTNEFPLADDSLKGGALNRVLDIQGSPGAIYEDPALIVNTCNGSYGFLGECFIRAIQNSDDFFEKIRKRQTEIFNKLKTKAAAEGRALEDKQTLPLSLILAVDEFVTDNIIRDGVKLNGYELIGHLKSREEVSEGQRAYREIIDFYNTNKQCFRPLSRTDGTSTDESKQPLKEYGYTEIKSEDKTYIHFIPSVLSKFMNENNRNLKAFCRWANNEGVLVSRDGNQNSKTINGKTRRVYTIIWDDTRDDIPEPEFNKCSDPELPFN